MQDGEEGSHGTERTGSANETKRSSRNLSEKRRRDRFNILVQELAGIVAPEDGRKLEKTAVLELAISYLRKNQSQLKSLPRGGRDGIALNWQPSFTADPEFNLIVSDALDSFTIATENNGNILYASDSVLSLLGYLCDELIGTSLFSYLNEEDALKVWSQLAVVAQNGDKTEMLAKGNLTFVLRMKCGRFYSRSSWQVVRCNVAVIHQCDDKKTPNCLVFVGKTRHPQPNRLLTTSDCAQKEFSYRLTMDWKYVYIDHRAASVIGFLPFEVLGTSFYSYCSPEDVFNIAQYHKFLIRVGKVTTCYYRHLTKGQSWVWLQSSCYISYNQWNSKPETITCTATVVSFNKVCLNQTETLQRDRERFARILPRSRSDPASLDNWASSPPDPFEEPSDQQDGTKAENHKENIRTAFNPRLFTRLLQTPSDQLIDVLDNQSTSSDVEMGSDDEQNEDLLWLENIKIPPELSSVQVATHLRLQEEYKNIAEQIKRQERQLKTIKKLIEWSNWLLALDSNFGVFGGESSGDSEVSVTSSVGSSSS
ncbi:hypothetical protein ACROYT_G037444 [Oculina patagonica]